MAATKKDKQDVNARVSRIFTNSELREMERRRLGDKSDRYGIFASKARPKIEELLYEWVNRQEDLKELIIRKEDKRQ